MEFEELSKKVIGCAIEVHKALGPGLLESAYEKCLPRELMLAGIRFQSQRPLPLKYKGAQVDPGYRVDLLVEDTLIVEIKSVEKLLGIHQAQLLTYLRLSGRRVGLLINFNVKLLKEGLRRFVL